MNVDKSFETLIARYLNGECSGQEVDELYTWVNQHPDHKKTYLAIKDTWDSLSGKDVSIDKQLAIFYKNQSERSKAVTISWWKQAVAAAAVLAIGLVSGILLTQQQSPVQDQEIAFSVPFGSKSSVTLPDGSEVMLNSGSKLTYFSTSTPGIRRVSLNGEAYFNVKKEEGIPFIVNASDFSIEVTGTEFNICTYDDNNFSSTTLTEGEVTLSFHKSGQQFELIPGERLRYDRETNRYSKALVDVEPEIAWKNSEFIFRSMAFSELVRRLERWYDVNITYSAEQLKDYTYTGRFKNQETIWQVLDALKLTTPIDYKRISFREFEILHKPARK
jgi:transmembrane sensor